MALRLLTTTRGIARSYMPTIVRKSATMTVFRGFATKKYTLDHEWISVDNGVGTFGITDYAQKALGDVVFVETPTVGQTVEKQEQVGAIESVKAASDIYSPVSGEVLDVNDELSNEPSLINSSPEENGWLAKIKLSNESELDDLMDEKAYIAHCEADDDH
ncbi:glycine cleavage H-protein-domain-containing protein [Cokeromyces recurvatus]|uniref:glycine cleavage H-protein-domain-containing protein n=1 Tax=Cokeromyces recurvatus TaxID=90255 RepID=UPI00221EC517|nr:glycine cleavage H-protein-domain-containing protein [Cokeromyces recurvatus]KAI7902892.1 glycine cleavage H-protein-domain-containing protein [Cokeromyces recurvatus]